MVYKEGRHKGISIITLVQGFKHVSTDVRDNTNIWILLNQKTKSRSKELADEYFSCFSDDDIMNGMKERDFWGSLIKYYTVTQPYNALMVFTEPIAKEFNFRTNVLQYKASK